MGVPGNHYESANAAARFELSNRLSQTTDTIWTVGQSNGEKLLLPSSAETAELIDIQLFDCLPVPRTGASFEDILEFKNRYHDELGQLRYRFDQLRAQITSSSENQRATKQAVEQIVKSMGDVEGALTSYGISSIKETIALYAQDRNLTICTSIGAIAAGIAEFPIHIGLASGIVVTTICRFLQRTFSNTRNLPDDAQDFAYVYEATKQFGRK